MRALDVRVHQIVLSESSVTTDQNHNKGLEAEVESGQDPVGSEPRYWIEYQGHSFELWHGPVTIGRASDCNLVLDDGLVSRRHAQLSLDGGRVLVEDLGSSNGVFVNGDRITGPRELAVSDELTIGKQLMLVRGPVRSLVPKARANRRMLAETMHSTDPLLLGDIAIEPEAVVGDTRGAEALELLAGVADKVLALGRGEEAEKMLGGQLEKVRLAARARQELDPQLMERAAGLAVRLASVTGKGAWVDYVFELYCYLKRPLPAQIVDLLYEVARKVSAVSLPVLRDYVATLRAGQAQFGPAEKFLFQRLEGLERLVASK